MNLSQHVPMIFDEYLYMMLNDRLIAVHYSFEELQFSHFSNN